MGMSIQSRLNSIIKHAVTGYPKNRSKQLSVFIHDYYRDVPVKEIVDRKSQSLAYIAKSHFELALAWKRGRRKIRIYNPDKSLYGWESKYTIIQIVTANIPFLVDTVMMELNRQGYAINLTIHPLLHLQRDVSGNIINISPFSTSVDSKLLESFIYMEIDKETDSSQIKQLTTSLNRVLEDTRLAVADRKPMIDNVYNIIKELETSPGPVKTSEVKQAISFLRWLLDNNFIFLGCRDYDLCMVRRRETLRIVPGSGRGILRERGLKHTPRHHAQLSPFSYGHILPSRRKQRHHQARIHIQLQFHSRYRKKLLYLCQQPLPDRDHHRRNEQHSLGR